MILLDFSFTATAGGVLALEKRRPCLSVLHWVVVWRHGRYMKIDVHIQKGWRHTKVRTWFCTRRFRNAHCCHILARDGCGGESYPPHNYGDGDGDGWWWFAFILPHNETAPLFLYMHYHCLLSICSCFRFCFCWWCIFSFLVDWRGKREGVLYSSASSLLSSSRRCFLLFL